MQIPEIKSRLSIEDVLSYYGLVMNRNKMLCCPFHEDKTPSMQVYPSTGTVFCFSSNCELNGKAIDQVDFILYKEGCSKHEAIEKAKSLAGHPSGAGQVSQKHLVKRANEPTSPLKMARIAVYSKLLYEAKESLLRSKRAKAYCAERGLHPEKLNACGSSPVGFLGDRFYQGWNERLKQSAVEIGLLQKRKNKSWSPVLRNCLVFALENKEGKPVSLYGRRITGDGKGKHYYTANREGLYPKYPPAETKRLIITESIIDAASLLQLPEITSHYELLSLYGTNGLTGEHTEAVSQLKELQEIIFFLDGDQAGDKAVEKYSKQLHELAGKAKITKCELPTGEDVNSLLVGHEPEIITHVLTERTLLFSSEKPVEKEKTGKPRAGNPQAEPTLDAVSETKLNTANPEKLVWERKDLRITVWGGIEEGSLHRLKLSLYLEEKKSGYGFRDEVNLYSNRGRKSFLQDGSEELNIAESELKEQVAAFTREIEEYRLKQKEEKKTLGKPELPKLTPREQAAAKKELADKALVQNIKSALKKAGLIGETDNGLLLFLIFLTRYFDNPLHALVHGSSGSGKTNLLKTVLSLVPKESKYVTTALTENVLFRPPHREFWKNKILLLEDLDGSYKALYPLREFMSNQQISKFVSEPDPKTGQFHQVLLEARGPIVIAGATTKDKVYEDNSNRSFLLHVDESREHQQKILDYQNRQAAGLIDREGTESVCQRIHNLQRVLNPDLKIINPFQPELRLPDYVFKKLRTNTHYITLIKAITFLHQYQRRVASDHKGNQYIETTLEDIALANDLSKHSLLRKSDELSGQVRTFFETLKNHLSKDGTPPTEKQSTFLAKKMRQTLRMHPMKFSRYINELRSRGYVKKTAGKEKGSFEYRIEVWDDYRVIKKGLDILDKTLEKLYKQYPDGIYRKRKKRK